MADRDNSRIEKFDARGHFLSSWPTWSLGQGRRASPIGVSVDDHDHVLVVSSDSGLIQEYDGRGKTIASF